MSHRLGEDMAVTPASVSGNDSRHSKQHSLLMSAAVVTGVLYGPIFLEKLVSPYDPFVNAGIADLLVCPAWPVQLVLVLLGCGWHHIVGLLAVAVGIVSVSAFARRTTTRMVTSGAVVLIYSVLTCAFLVRAWSG